MDSTSNYSKCNILFLICLYFLQGENFLSYNTVLLFIGIVQFEGETPSSNTKNTITMVEPFKATVAWLWQISQYPRGSIFGRGWPRAGCKGYIQLCKSVINNFFSNLIDFYFIILYRFNLYHCQNNGIAPPPPCALAQLNLFPCTPLVAPPCFWLAVVSIYCLVAN